MVITGCDGVADMGVRLKVTEPQGQVRGTIVFGVGGPGTGFYETFGAAASERVLVPLAMMGFRLVQRGWDAPGWLSGPGGPMKEACRSATMYDAIYKNIHTDGAYCATGQSAGSAEIAYALAHYGAEAIFDGVVPSAGPPLGRIDHGCLGLDDPAWINECDNLRTCPGGSCTYLGIAFDFLDGAYANNDCSTHRQGSRQTFLDDSVLNPLADLDYPQTAMRFVYGGADCSEAVPLGRVYADGVRSDKAIAVVPGVDHIIPASTAGADQIFADLVDVCIPRH
jgi:hypothetical protein